MKRLNLKLFLVLFVSIVFIPFESSGQQPVVEPTAGEPLASEEIGVETPAGEAFRWAILSGIATYPDEVIAAVLEVVQDPEALLGEKKSDSEVWKAAYSYLSEYPRLLSALKEHPGAVQFLRRWSQKDLTGFWKSIDAVRAKFPKDSTAPSPPVQAGAEPASATEESSEKEASAETGTPPPVPPVGYYPTYVNVESEEDEEPYVVQSVPSTVFVSPIIPYYAEPVPSSYYYPPPGQTTVIYTDGGSGTEVDGGQSGTTTQHPTTTAGATGGVVTTDDGNVYAAGAAGAVVETENGTAVVGAAGHAQVDTTNGSFETGVTAGAVNSNGDGVVAHRESSGSFDGDSLHSLAHGNVQATNGQGATWQTERNLQKTADGFNAQSSQHVETNAGGSADINRSLDVGQDGVDIDRSGSATTASGQTYNWGNTDSAATVQTSQKTAGGDLQETGKQAQKSTGSRFSRDSLNSRMSSLKSSSPVQSAISQFSGQSDSPFQSQRFSRPKNLQDLSKSLNPNPFENRLGSLGSQARNVSPRLAPNTFQKKLPNGITQGRLSGKPNLQPIVKPQIHRGASFSNSPMKRNFQAGGVSGRGHGHRGGRRR